uniref:Uncharacterized protein n=1 Tax=viral metagenome TaxID=1070528 RepID=A0A6C0CR18_9ZZZZ
MKKNGNEPCSKNNKSMFGNFQCTVPKALPNTIDMTHVNIKHIDPSWYNVFDERDAKNKLINEPMKMKNI